MALLAGASLGCLEDTLDLIIVSFGIILVLALVRMGELSLSGTNQSFTSRIVRL